MTEFQKHPTPTVTDIWCESVEKMVRELFVPGFEATLRSDSFGISYREPWIDLSELNQDNAIALPVPPLHHTQPVEYLEGLLHEWGDRQGVPTRSDAVVEIGPDRFRLKAHPEAVNLSDGEVFCWIPGPHWLTVRMVLDSHGICIRFDRAELFSSPFDFWFRRIRPWGPPA